MLIRLFRPVGAALLAVVLPLVLSLGPVSQVHAEDIALKKVLQNGVAGASIGALVGTAVLAFVDNPGDRLEFVTTGAALGLLAGVGWGFYDSSRAYVSYENGRFTTALPTPSLRRVASGVERRSGGVMLVSKLLAVGF